MIFPFDNKIYRDDLHIVIASLWWWTFLEVSQPQGCSPRSPALLSNMGGRKEDLGNFGRLTDARWGREIGGKTSTGFWGGGSLRRYHRSKEGLERGRKAKELEYAEAPRWDVSRKKSRSFCVKTPSTILMLTTLTTVFFNFSAKTSSKYLMRSLQ